MKIKHLLIDLDGTLVDNTGVSVSIDFLKRSVKALKKYGGWLKIIKTLYAINLELNKPVHSWKEFRNDQRVLKLFADGMGFSSQQAKEILDTHLSEIFKTLENHFYPVKGAQEFILWASQRWPLTLATNPAWPEKIIKMRVGWAGIDSNAFQLITHINKMHAFKPSLQYYREILDLLEVEPSDCLLVGNDVKMDLPAVALGIPVFIVDANSKGLKKIDLKKYKLTSNQSAWTGTYEDLKTILL